MRFPSLVLLSGCAFVDAAGDPHGTTPSPLTFTSVNVDNTSAQPRNAVVAHINGDPMPDLVVIGQTGEIYTCFGNGVGGFAPAVPVTTAGTSWDLIMAANLGGDSRDEVIVVSMGQLAVLKPNDTMPGELEFIDLDSFAQVGQPSAVVADIFDGGQAVVLASRGAAELLVLKDVVASPQMSTISAPNFGTPPHTVLLGTGRFRGGASASLITAELGAGSLSLIDSPGIPNPPVGGSIIEGPPLQAFAVGKFFGSFEEDVAYVSGNIDGPPSLKFLTGSAGGLSPEGASFGQGTDTEVLGSGDFDGDGQADLVALVVDQAEARHLKFFLQQSSGTFLATQIDLEGRPGRLTLGDLNGDGKTDIALSQDSAQQAQGGLNILLSN